MANIRISDDIYTKIKGFADKEMRSVANATEYLLVSALGSLMTTTPLPKNTEVTKPEIEELIKGGQVHYGRTKRDVIADIREAETMRNEELMYCQDEDTRKTILNDSQNAIGELWDEYRTLDA